MSDDPLARAQGTADAAWSLSRALLQLLGERGIIPPDLLLEAIDALAFAAEDVAGPIARSGHEAVRLHLYQRLLDDLADIPAFQTKQRE